MFWGAKSEGFLQDCAARYSPIFLAQHGSIIGCIFSAFYVKREKKNS